MTVVNNDVMNNAAGGISIGAGAGIFIANWNQNTLTRGHLLGGLSRPFLTPMSDSFLARGEFSSFADGLHRLQRFRQHRQHRVRATPVRQFRDCGRVPGP